MTKIDHPAMSLNRIRKRNASIDRSTAPVASTDGGWEITARAVPLDTPTEIAPGFVETIQSGALVPRETGVKLFSEHRDVIGVVTQTGKRTAGSSSTPASPTPSSAGTYASSSPTAPSPR